MTPKQWLRGKRACKEGVEFALQFKSMKEVWEKCERGDWMIWILRQINKWTQEEKVEIAFACASHVLKIYERQYPKDDRPRKALDAVKRWLKNPTGENSHASLGAAHTAAHAAAAYAADAAHAAYAAADAADAAADTAYAAAHAAYAADAAVYTAAHAAYAAYAADTAAHAAEQKWQANTIRKIVKNPFTR